MKKLILFPSITATALLLVSACAADKRAAMAKSDAPAADNVAQVAVVEVPVEEFLKDGSDPAEARNE